MLEALICATLIFSDGDSGRCVTADGERHRVRLHGVDAAEVSPYSRCRTQPTIWACRAENRRYGPIAARLARSLAADGARCQVIDKDRYQRLVVTCRVDGRDLGETLVRAGVVIADPTYGRHLRSIEAEARREGRGMWE